MSAEGYHYIRPNTLFCKRRKSCTLNRSGFFQTDFLNPTRKDLATIYDRLRRAFYPFTGFADHGVSEALYLNDPDENGVELYWDKPKDQWPKNEDGSLLMYTKALDLEELLKELN